VTKRYLGLLIILGGVVLMSFSFTSVVLGFSIASPAPGAIFHPGDNINVSLQFDPAETPVEVGVVTFQMNLSELRSSEPYVFILKIPPKFIGKGTLVAFARYADGTATKKEVEISVVLPITVVLTGISVDPAPLLLKKHSEGSDPNDIRISETRHIGVGGIYSDGIERYISDASDGTTYTSSDEKVVTVDSEGNLKAQGIGDATITVKNGKFSAIVKVTVDPYEKWIKR
jgi:hypothetical protein